MKVTLQNSTSQTLQLVNGSGSAPSQIAPGDAASWDDESAETMYLIGDFNNRLSIEGPLVKVGGPYGLQTVLYGEKGAVLELLLSTTLSQPKTYSDLNSDLQTTFSNLITVEGAIKANPSQIDSLIALITNFTGNQITISQLNDQLQKYAASPQTYNALSDGLQYTFRLLGPAISLIGSLNGDLSYYYEFLSIMQGFASQTSNVTVQYLNTQIATFENSSDNSNPNCSDTYSDQSPAIQATFDLLKDFSPSLASDQALVTQYQNAIINFTTGQLTLAQLNAQLKAS